jgi:molybdate transport system regulatory protein
MKVSARNFFKGKVQQIKAGAVNTEVVIRTDEGTEIVSIITKESAKRLGLKKGKKVYAAIKASQVMLLVD